ncbi:serine O-acetyltransferase [Flavobacterium capsici]|uniref:Serine acetyltransferase n=1 Tax=Flavobacterium capsici TaxID=3075618 RepID=A0AA96J4R1_9FLAO|nr:MULTISPECIES: hypothetical protein [unclassified Flavobacterium]WNM20225.1 hypothetical protein RN608_05975 [Flavobacterium sp. PMR2A8]WNM21615.1 hypothetical protein RN605_13145 [Flavobacterium sp. PMTSA4]
MIFDENECGKIIKELFEKYYFTIETELTFDDFELYNKCIEIFKFDYFRYYNNYDLKIQNIFLRIELIGILLYRIANQYHKIGKDNIAIHYSNLGRLISGFEIYFSSDIGKGLKVNHGLGTVIGARVIIGENALIHQNVTLGDKAGGRPVLKNNVIVYAGAKILGAIVCGNNSIIGANSVCLIDVPENSSVVGIPGKIYKKK